LKRINLIPDDVKKTPFLEGVKTFLIKNRMFSGVILAASVMIYITVWQTAMVAGYKASILKGKGAIREIKKDLAGARDRYAVMENKNQEVENEIKRISMKIGMLKKMRHKRLIWSKILIHLPGLVPEDLWISKMSLEGEKLVITGMTTDNVNVSVFMTCIDDSTYFENTGFNFTQKKKIADREIINFEVTTDIVSNNLVKQ